jgi:glycosyltransferase involved in cell wall biosynthesis
MRVALIASSFLPEPGRLERRVDQLARGLAGRGAEVEILTHGPMRSTVHQCEGVTVHRFPTAVGPLRFTVAPKLWDRLRLTSEAFDLVDVHTRNPSLTLAVARTRVRRLVFTPGAPMDAFLGWPRAGATRAFIGSTAQIVCHSEIERDLLCQAIPGTAGRTHVLPDGVDTEALRAAEPFVTAGVVVLAVDRLHGQTWVRRAIAAMPSLDPEFRLVIVGDGPARDRLAAYADDLRVASRVQFAGRVSDAVLYRWLRTARVVVTLAGERGSGSQVTEARAAGASVVASDLPIHRESAGRTGGSHVIFVAPKGSPLDVADAIDEAARVSVLPNTGLAFSAPSWQSVVDDTLMLYGQPIGTDLRPARHRAADELVGVAAQIRAESDARDERSPHARVNGGRRWR